MIFLWKYYSYPCNFKKNEIKYLTSIDLFEKVRIECYKALYTKVEEIMMKEKYP